MGEENKEEYSMIGYQARAIQRLFHPRLNLRRKSEINDFLLWLGKLSKEKIKSFFNSIGKGIYTFILIIPYGAMAWSRYISTPDINPIERIKKSKRLTIDELKKLLETGDILLSRVRSREEHDLVMRYLMPKFSRFLQRNDYGHGVLYDGNGKVLEFQHRDIPKHNRSSGINSVDLEKDFLSINDVVVIRLKIDKKIKQEAIEYAKGQVGKFKNSPVKNYLRLAFLPARNKGESARKSPEMTCGSFLQKAYDKVDFSKKKAKKHILPSEILGSRKTDVIGWFGEKKYL